MTYPIILAHGFARFDFLLRADNDKGMDSFHYWRNIRTILEKRNYQVYHTDVDWAGTVSKRAGQLAEKIKNYQRHLGAPKINIIAHSMGGLDARYAIVKCGLGPLVASLTTLGTPHHGTALADWGTKVGLTGTVTSLFNMLGIDFKGFSDLTTEACAARNRELQDSEERGNYGILYQTYAGVQKIDDIFWPLLPSYRIIQHKEGDNDGLVSESSAMWQSRYYKGKRDLDHLNLVGWWDPAELDWLGGKNPQQFEREIEEFYLAIAAGLP